MEYFFPALITFVLSSVLTFLVRRLALKWNIVDLPDNPRKIHTAPIPLLGGLAIWLSFFIVAFSFLGRLTAGDLEYHHWIGVFFGGLILMIGGFGDDKYNFKPGYQIIFPILAVLCVVLGGVEIDVERAFDDYRYPILGRESAEPYESRFEHLHFEQGAQIMDGAAALKYARSRHAAGPEGSDFARTKRQQKIIQAVKDKLLSSQIVFDPALIADIFQELKENISTNLKIWEMYKLWQIGKEIDSQQIITKVVDNSPNGLLIDSISDQGAYVLTPRSGDFAEIQYFIANIFTDAPLADKSKVISEHASVEVRNGTWINGLASQVALDLEKFGFRVVRIGNSNRQNFQKTVIYDLTYGEKSEALEVLRSKTEANVSPDLPEWLMTDINADVSGQEKPVQPDFILVLGQEADMTKSGKENPDD